MFEDALMESAGKIRTQRGWVSGLATIFNGAAVILLVLWPLVHPALLPRQTISMLLAAPAPPAAPSPPMHRAVSVVTRSATLSNPFAVPVRIPAKPRKAEDMPPSARIIFTNAAGPRARSAERTC